MDVEQILRQVDEYYDRQQGPEAEKLMQSAIKEAVEQEDDESLLHLLNELLGYYRETGQADNSYAIAGQCISIADRMGLKGTIPYATTLLNVANAYRAGGRLEDSLELYLKVREIYEKNLAPDDVLIAGLENNISLLYQELDRFSEAKNCQLKALRIVEPREDCGFETAVSHANLAASCLRLGEDKDARKYAELAIAEFETRHLEDSHHSAALSALATYFYQKKEYAKALALFTRAMEMVERNLGRNASYERLRENAEACRAALERNEAAEMPAKGGAAVRAEQNDAGEDKGAGSGMSGMELCRAYYETYGKPMIAEKFSAYENKIAVGLVGKGSDCFGYDDALSRDHDWGPDFCMWVTEETYAAIGEELKKAYEELPAEFRGYRRIPGMQERGRRGVFTINGFFEKLLGAPDYDRVDWREVPDYALASVVNGCIFRDDEGIFTGERDRFKQGYPDSIRFLKMADSAARFSQTGQYNYPRLLKRGDAVSAEIMLADSMREAMKLQHYIENRFPPHDKWLYRSLQETEAGRQLAEGLQRILEAEDSARAMSQNTENKVVMFTQEPGKRATFTMGREQGTAGVSEAVEETAAFLMRELYERSFISDSETYLDAHSEELAQKSAFAACTVERLAEWIAEVEFAAFDKVKNVGGRADCQDDWPTFSIMRKSQYLTWNREMLMQYLYDFQREMRQDHNLIEEKYGRMMESTAPEEYERIKDRFPVLTPEKKAIIEQIVGVQVAWMEEFAAKYPSLADNARSIRTGEDALYNTSYETYLRGELGTYSDKMLELYGRYVVEHAKAGKNLAYEIMGNSVRLYGYESMEAAERFLSL